ncbi:MAG: hypothetical protein R2839_09250 [Thermomicrobiales bacterium]
MDRGDPDVYSGDGEPEDSGGDADVDNFLQATYADPNDIEAEVIASRSRAVANMYVDAFFNSDTGVNPKGFDGLTKALDGTGQSSRPVRTAVN